MHNQTISQRGIEHLKKYEGFRSHAYDDFAPDKLFKPGDKLRGTLTIGYGHTGMHARAGNVIDEAIAEAALGDDLAAAKGTVAEYVTAHLNGDQYDALVSFVFNVGSANFRNSTLLRKLNAGDVDGAGMEFRRWVYSKGVRLKGLVLRREAEAAMFSGTGIAVSLFEGPLDSAGYVADLAKQGEELLGLGSAARPDAVEERGVMKPARKSKTIIASAFGLTGAAITGIASALKALDVPGIFQAMPPEVQMVTSLWMGAACLFLIWNRLRESREGEH